MVVDRLHASQGGAELRRRPGPVLAARAPVPRESRHVAGVDVHLPDPDVAVVGDEQDLALDADAGWPIEPRDVARPVGPPALRADFVRASSRFKPNNTTHNKTQCLRIRFCVTYVLSPGIEPGVPVPQTGVLSVKLREQ